MTHTTAIIIITLIITLLCWQNPAWQQRLMFSPPAVARGQVDRLLTHGFIHADAMHLLFNVITLYSFGRVIEHFYVQKFGNLGFVGFYCLAIVVAIIPSYYRQKNNPRYLSLGASGGVSAVLFAYILFAPWNLLWFFGLLPIPAIVFALLYVGYSLYADKRGGDRINHSAHLVGAVFGVLATVVIDPSVLGHFLQALLRPLQGF